MGGTNLQIYRDPLTYSHGPSVKQLEIGHIILLFIFEKIKDCLESGGDSGHLFLKSYHIHLARSEHEMTN